MYNTLIHVGVYRLFVVTTFVQEKELIVITEKINMKTTIKNLSKSTKKKHAKMLIAIITLCLQSTYIFSQKIKTQDYRFGVGIGNHITGNSLGSVYEGNVYLSDYNNTFSFGVCMQKRKNQVCGVSLGYMKSLFAKDDCDGTVAPLFLYARLQYMHQAILSYKAQKLEEKFYVSTTDHNIDFSNYKTSTADLFVGFGGNIQIAKNLVWSNSVGFGTFYHVNYIPGMYHERMTPVLMLGTGLRLTQF